MVLNKNVQWGEFYTNNYAKNFDSGKAVEESAAFRDRKKNWIIKLEFKSKNILCCCSSLSCFAIAAKWIDCIEIWWIIRSQELNNIHIINLNLTIYTSYHSFTNQMLTLSLSPRTYFLSYFSWLILPLIAKLLTNFTSDEKWIVRNQIIYLFVISNCSRLWLLFHKMDTNLNLMSENILFCCTCTYLLLILLQRLNQLTNLISNKR